MMSIYDASSLIHPIPEYKTSKHGIIYINIICKYKKKKQKSKWGHGCEIKKIPVLALRGLSSNGHNFFVSNPNRTPFEAMDS